MKHFFLKHAAFTGALFLGVAGTHAQAATFTVSNLNDSGVGSLRQALASANTTSEADTITFASSVRGTLPLNSGELAISSDISIVGPGKDALIISGNNKSRLFTITSGTVVLSGLSITNGFVQGKEGATGTLDVKPQRGEDVSGGAIVNQGNLTLTNCSLRNNTAQGGKGGPGMPSTFISGGMVLPGPGASGGVARGGAIFSTGTLKLVSTGLQSNIAQGGAGGWGGVDRFNQHGARGGDGGATYGGAIYNRGSIQLNAKSSFLGGNRSVGGAGGWGTAFHVDGAPGVGYGNELYDATPRVLNTTFSGMTGAAFRGQLRASGEAISYVVVSGSLPEGLKLDTATGVITGTPTRVAVGQRLTFKVNDRYGDSNSAVATFNIQPESLLSINAPSVREGNGGITMPSQLVFTLTRSKDTSGSASVVVQTAPASTASAVAKSDYVPLNPTRITFAPGQTRQTVVIPIVGDTVYEDNEQVALLLSSPIGLVLAASRSQGAILNDDPLPAISINDVSIPEGNSGSTKAIFTLTLSNPSARTISVGYSTYSRGRGAAIGGMTTTADVDYLIIPSTTLTFLPGQTSKTITVSIKGDTIVEGDEPFLVNLSAPLNARLADGIGLGIIQNDDGDVTVKSSTGSSGSGGNS